MPADVLEVTHRFMRNPVRILVKKEELTLEGIRQFYVQVEREVRAQIKKSHGSWMLQGLGEFLLIQASQKHLGNTDVCLGRQWKHRILCKAFWVRQVAAHAICLNMAWYSCSVSKYRVVWWWRGLL